MFLLENEADDMKHHQIVKLQMKVTSGIEFTLESEMAFDDASGMVLEEASVSEAF